jgi:hypothetical protein
MRKMVILLMAIIVVAGFVNVIGAENKARKTQTVSLQTFVNSVAGRTYQDIVARFGKPSCEGHPMRLGMLYEHFVKDERTGEILSVRVLFQKGIPIGTVRVREGRRIIGPSNVKYVATNIICQYYSFKVERADDLIVQDYIIYVKPIPWGPRYSDSKLLSCEQLNKENDRINQNIKQRDGEKTE